MLGVATRWVLEWILSHGWIIKENWDENQNFWREAHCLGVRFTAAVVLQSIIAHKSSLVSLTLARLSWKADCSTAPMETERLLIYGDTLWMREACVLFTHSWHDKVILIMMFHSWQKWTWGFFCYKYQAVLWITDGSLMEKVDPTLCLKKSILSIGNLFFKNEFSRTVIQNVVQKYNFYQSH